MTNKLKPMTAGWHKRQRVWRHNAFTGFARMMQMQARAIMESDSTSKDAKQIATNIWCEADQLADALKTRIDP